MACSNRTGGPVNIEGQLEWSFQSVDSCTTKAPLGGQDIGASPTDRGKGGTKRHILTDTNGLPISLLVSGANVHDQTRAEPLLSAMPFLTPGCSG